MSLFPLLPPYLHYLHLAKPTWRPLGTLHRLNKTICNIQVTEIIYVTFATTFVIPFSQYFTVKTIHMSLRKRFKESDLK